jgi:hypothetical protein
MAGIDHVITTPHPRNLIRFRRDELKRDSSARGSFSWPNRTDVTNYVLLKQREHKGREVLLDIIAPAISDDK